MREADINPALQHNHSRGLKATRGLDAPAVLCPAVSHQVWKTDQDAFRSASLDASSQQIGSPTDTDTAQRQRGLS